MIEIIISIFLIALCDDLVLGMEFHILAWAAAVCSIIKVLIWFKKEDSYEKTD